MRKQTRKKTAANRGQARREASGGRKWLRRLRNLLLLGVLFCLLAHTVVVVKGSSRILALGLSDGEILSGLPEEKADCILILGAGLWNGYPSAMLRERLDLGAALYRAGAAPKILVTGDNGSKDYNEVQAMEDYLVKVFWKDHKKMYQNRPIYWLFSSKKGAFQCLAYMHRMDANTADKVRSNYLMKHMEWLRQSIAGLEANAVALSTTERNKLKKLKNDLAECEEYNDRLQLIADSRIAFDLDDGVVVNYAKFGDVLAKIK